MATGLLVLAVGLLLAFMRLVPPSRPPMPLDQEPAYAPVWNGPGTGVIRGRVTDAVGGQPLDHVHLRLAGGNTNDPQLNSDPAADVMSDASGGFAFNGLRAGLYSIWVHRQGYQPGYFPAASGPTVRGFRGVTLTEGEKRQLAIPLFRISTILGRVTDAHGRPSEGATVVAMPVAGTRSLRRSAFQIGTTDRAGRFSIPVLPGAYYLRVFDAPHDDRTGIGPTMVLPTLYPGVRSLYQARPVTVARARAISGIDIRLIEQPATTVTGIVLDATDQPAPGGSVGVRTETWLGDNISSSLAGARIRPDGTFVLKLPHGDYRLTAITAPHDSILQHPDGERYVERVGRRRLTVGPEPIANVVINARDTPSTISGSIVFEGSAPPLTHKQMAIVASSLRATSSFLLDDMGRPDGCRGSARINPDMTFTIAAAAGTCGIEVNADGRWGEWQPKSAMYGDIDLFEHGVEILPGTQMRDVRITFSTRHTSLVADVTDDRGAPTQDYVLLAFSTDKTRWPLRRAVEASARWPEDSPFATMADQVEQTSISAILAGAGAPMARPPNRGILAALPPGEYYVVAIDDADVEDLHNPAFLDPLVSSATRVTLRDGEPQRVRLHRVKAPAFSQ